MLLACALAAPAAAQDSDRREQGERGPDLQQLEQILEGLEHGMVACERLGSREELAALARLAAGVRARLREGREQQERRGERSEHLEREIELLQVAHHAMREIERPDSAELLERAIHAKRMDLAGREDPESREIRARAPKLGAQLELVTYASKVWDEFGHEAKAAHLREYALELRVRWDQDRAREGVAADAQPAPGGVEARLRRLEAQMQELTAAVRELTTAFRQRGPSR
ncbi:MAG TPA: hypothetical protein VGC54_13515 [Planctomycetota bacterium]